MKYISDDRKKVFDTEEACLRYENSERAREEEYNKRLKEIADAIDNTMKLIEDFNEAFPNKGIFIRPSGFPFLF